MIRKSIGSRLFNGFNIFFLGLLAVVMVFPLWNILMTSLVDTGEYFSRMLILWPRKVDLSAYRYIFSGHEYINAMAVTVFTTVAGGCYSLIVTTALAYGLSKKYLPGRNFFLVLITITMFFQGGLIPYFLLIKKLGLMESLAAIILPNAVITFYFIVIKAFFSQISVEMEESAKVDGANDITIFIKIVLPVSTAVLATFFLFYAVIYWNQWFQSMIFIHNKDLRPLQLVLRDLLIESSGGGMEQQALEQGLKRQNISTEGIRAATVIVSTVPILVVYPFLQKYFAKGIMLGSVKG